MIKKNEIVLCFAGMHTLWNIILCMHVLNIDWAPQVACSVIVYPCVFAK